MNLTLKVVTLTRDHGDGSSSTYLYNTMSDLLNEAVSRINEDRLEDFGIILAENEELTEEQEKIVREIIEDDPYEYGSLGTDSIELVLEDGKIRLASPTSIYGNQQ